MSYFKDHKKDKICKKNVFNANMAQNIKMIWTFKAVHGMNFMHILK